jgi:hypothetical protein
MPFYVGLLKFNPAVLLWSNLALCLFLVVPDRNYNSAVPVLIGTNILSSFIDQLQGTYGDKYLQE